MSVPQTLTCDVCGVDVRLPDGYCLTTTQIVSAPGQWRQYYTMHKEEMASLGMESYEEFCRQQPIFQTIFMIAANATPWMVCESCIEMFDVDKTVAHEYVKKWYESDGSFVLPSGAAPHSAIDMGDGRSWD